jgi:hypothetical protein
MGNRDQWATIRPVGNTFEPNSCQNWAKMMQMGNSETNGQHFWPKARVLPIGLTHCIQQCLNEIKLIFI